VHLAAAPIASKRSVMANRGRWAQIGPKFGGLLPCHRQPPCTASSVRAVA